MGAMRSFLLFVLSLFGAALHASAIPDGQIETFSGSIGQWSSAMGSLSVGNSGGDAYLRYASSTASTYKAVIYNNNASSMWNGDYNALVLLSVQAINFGPDALNLRLGFAQGANHIASLTAQALPADGQWHNLRWSLNPSNFSPSGALTGITMLRFMSNTDGSFSGDLVHADWGLDDIQVFATLPTATPTFSQTFTRTISPTWTSTTTPSNTSTLSSTVTPSVTPSITPTWSDSPTASETPSMTPTFSESPTSTESPSSTQTPTMTATATQTVTWSSSPSPSSSPTVTATPSPTPIFSPTPTLVPWLRPGLAGEGTGPGLLQRGQPLCLAFSVIPPQLTVEVFNIRGERCAKWQDQACADSAGLAAGVYYLFLKAPGLERVQKLVLRP